MDLACTWPIDYAACGAPPEPDPDEPDSPAPAASIPCGPLADMAEPERAKIERMASEMLWAWTGRVFGVCPVEVRPCRGDCAGASARSTFGGPIAASSGLGTSGGAPWSPVLIGGEWFNVSCGSCLGAGCACDEEGPAAIRLPGPVVEVDAVIVDGVTLDPSAYSVDRRSILRRLDGGTWPTCQRLDLPAGEPGTWVVEYARGVAVPVGGQIAAGLLACELAKAMCGDSTCQLPRRVTSVTRQGVSIGAVLDPFEDLRDGRTGIWAIDSWVASVNAPAPRASRVLSPDLRRRVDAWPR